MSCFGAYQATATALTSGAYVKLTLDALEYDFANVFDPNTNFRFTAPAAGVWHFDGAVEVVCSAAGQRVQCALFKNGSSIKGGVISQSQSAVQIGSQVTADLLLSAGDYVELYCFVSAASLSSVAAQSGTFLTGHQVN